jgi:signal transduction histidine kinase
MPLFGMYPANLLETIFDQVLLAALVVDTEHRIAYANNQALQILGIPQTIVSDHLPFEDLSRNYHVFDSSGNEIPLEQLPVRRVLAGEDIEPYNIKLELPGGYFKWLHVTAHRFSVMGLSGALIVATDETREVELQRVAASIQKAEALSALAGALAHNFNNILSIINLSALACLESPDVGPGARARLQQISDASRHASDLTKRLAQFSRAQELRPRPVSITQVIRNAVALVEPLLFSNIKVITKLHPDLPDVETDPVEMEQVVFNLMLNARDAMPQGGELTVATDLQDRPPEARIRGGDKQCVTITISDTGSGIPKAIVDRIFEPFFTKPNGTGLGLASAQGIVRQHGGDIKVQSSVGHGTQFTVYLPTSRRNAVIVGGGPAIGKL